MSLLIPPVSISPPPRAYLTCEPTYSTRIDISITQNRIKHTHAMLDELRALREAALAKKPVVDNRVTSDLKQYCLDIIAAATDDALRTRMRHAAQNGVAYCYVYECPNDRLAWLSRGLDRDTFREHVVNYITSAIKNYWDLDCRYADGYTGEGEGGYYSGQGHDAIFIVYWNC